MLDPLHACTPGHLQLGEGVLLRGTNLDAALLAADPAAVLAELLEKEQHRLGVTRSGCIFRCVPRMVDATGGHRTPAEGETLVGRWEVTLSGTLMEISPANAALLLNIPEFAVTGGRTVMVPEPTPVPESSGDVCWVGDMGGGLLAIHLRRPISTGGLVFHATPDGLGEMPFTLMAQKRHPQESGVPCRLLWLPEVTA
ncbi:MAG: hypothetical protein IKK57_00805 [Clostridia bacterium]|nr:hypothetical protein [Clostridia bacterium]